MEKVDAVLCAVIAIQSAWIIRQTMASHHRIAWLFRLPLGLMSGVMFWQCLELIDGRAVTTPLDVVEHASWVGLFVMIIFFHRHRFGRL